MNQLGLVRFIYRDDMEAEGYGAYIDQVKEIKMTEQRAILAGGCFWGMQDLIRKYDGVLSTRVGYSGGDVANATYRNHGSHAEAIEIVFDPTRLSYRKLLEYFFQLHDPTTRNRQGNDAGLSYRSAIFFTSEAQKRVVGRLDAVIKSLGLFNHRPIADRAAGTE